jgi:hypothetical protein
MGFETDRELGREKEDEESPPRRSPPPKREPEENGVLNRFRPVEPEKPPLGEESFWSRSGE